MAKSFANKLIGFYEKLQPPAGMPPGIKVLFPQSDPLVRSVVNQFLKKFFSNDHPRRLVFGINPGRFGAGTTGINFTAPKQLKQFCGIDHPFKQQTELSAEFIYEVIEHYGGVKNFYADYFISAVSPLGFTKNGKNMNYYDDRKLQEAVTPFIVDCIQKQISFAFKTDSCICVGEEKNFKFLTALNERYSWFQKIIPLPHPRFILQYRRKQKEKYIHLYLSALRPG